MSKKLVLMLMVVAVGLICWTVLDVQAQQAQRGAGGAGAGAGGQQRGGQQATPDEMLKFLKANGFTADAAALEAVAKDVTKQTALMTTLNQKYGQAIRAAAATPGSEKVIVERLKAQNEVDAAVAAAKTATDKPAAIKKATEAAGKLFDMILAQQSAAPAAAAAGRGAAAQPTPPATLAAWKKNKDAIVKVYVDGLMLDVPAAFPWAGGMGARRGG